MTTIRIEKVHSESRHFQRWFRIRAPRRGAELMIGDVAGKGGFGTVHPVAPGQGRRGEPALLVKVLKETALVKVGGANALISSVSSLHRATDGCAEARWHEEVKAMPFSIATALVQGQQRLVTLMLDLSALGYEVIKFSADAELEKYQDLATHEHLEFAFGFARRAAFFERIKLVHGDLNPENLMFHPGTLDVQVIDLDVGAVIETGAERPLTPGKPGECMPPEIKRPGAHPEPFDLEKLTAGAERWSVGSVVGILLFGVHPGFFLKAISERTLDAYSQEGACWPQIDVGGPSFSPDAEVRAIYRSSLPILEAAPGDTGEALAKFFAAGVDGDARPSAKEWIAALDAARRPPRFEYVVLEPDVVIEGDEIAVSWEAKEADRVECQFLGKLEPAGEATLTAHRTTRFTFTAINFYGRTEQVSNTIQIVPLPRIERIPVGEFPGFSLASTFALPMTTLPPAFDAPPRFAGPIAIPRSLPAPIASGALPRLQLPPLPYLTAQFEPLFPRIGSPKGDNR